jgi:hypothetical protein
MGNPKGSARYTAIICRETCPEPEFPEGERDPEIYLWSDPETWDSGAVPVEGEDVSIKFIKQIKLDVDPPALGTLTINGVLIFDTEKEETLL